MSSKASGSSKRKKKRNKHKQQPSSAEVNGLPDISGNGLENERGTQQLNCDDCDSPKGVQTVDANTLTAVGNSGPTKSNTEGCVSAETKASDTGNCLSTTQDSTSKSAAVQQTTSISSRSTDTVSTESKSQVRPKSKKGVSESTLNSTLSQKSALSSSTTTFEEELCWCVGQLELGILRKDATKTQKQVNEKHIRTLQSTKTPLPKKRQLMRSLFGDYRSKMKSQPLPERTQTSPKISTVEQKVLEVTGMFYKQSTSSTSGSCVNRKQEPPLQNDQPLLSKQSLSVGNTHNDSSNKQFSFHFEITPEMMS